MSAADQVYRLLLRAYPPAFRAEYGREMTLAFRDARRAPDGRGPRFWAAMLWDVLRSAPRLRAEERFRDNLHPGERPMKTMAILAMVVGVLEIINAALEGMAATKGAASAGWMLAVVAVGIVGLLLIAAGVAMLRGARTAAAMAKVAAVACLLVVAIVRACAPWMSMFGMLIGVVFPIALLVFVWKRGSGATRLA